MVKLVDAKEFDQIIKTDDLILVDMFATWCGPCQMMSPTIDEIEKEFKGKALEVITVDIDKNPEVAAKYSIMSVPTFLFIKKDKVLDTVVGAVAKDILTQKIDSLIDKK